ncbi:helix-turn-helix domain-containing protein [Vibrio sp. YMD68]|uniref:helix-turn-helix domain-containing protein n=1 Tax=Vibrio sp. YMD68 TaxID=3042300 RepID=UPI00249B0982|nr:helix-turn-helix domain-containing protein [Vibrio sp. YMD68]WGV98246.1 helix-turn-helix domain-containing protein [Vibrio sp. YMD68]
MTTTYQLKSHLKHNHVRFAYVDGYHSHDFATHKHDYSELFIVIAGTGKHQVAGHSYPLSIGDVFVINGDVEHGFNDVNDLRIINLMFDSNLPFFDSPQVRLLPGYQALFTVEPIARQNNEYPAKLTLNPEQLTRLSNLLVLIETEYNDAPIGFESMLASLMQQLVITLSRAYQGDSTESNQPTLALSRALVYIERHYASAQLNSNEIAKASFVSQRQMERLFRQFLQTSPNQYIRNIQQNQAALLLKEQHELSIQSISESCGFSDSNYFSKCFKKHFGVSPRQYRKESLLQRE